MLGSIRFDGDLQAVLLALESPSPSPSPGTVFLASCSCLLKPAC